MSSHSQRGVGSVEVTSKILEAMLEGIGALPLKEIAQRSGISAARIHPYLVSLIKTGLVDQDPATGHYDLGPQALRLGVASLQRLDPVRVSIPLARDLARALAHTVAIAVWSNTQAVIIHIEEAVTPIRVTLRHGSVMSLTQTATGLLFAAHLARSDLEQAIKLDQIQPEFGERLPVGFLARPKANQKELLDKLQDIRDRGSAAVTNTAVPGLGAISAPVFDHTGKMVLAMTCIGLSATLNTDETSAARLELGNTAERASKLLGFKHQ